MGGLLEVQSAPLAEARAYGMLLHLLLVCVCSDRTVTDSLFI